MSVNGGRRVGVIVNPTAGRGRGARVLARARPILERAGITDITTTPGSGKERAIVDRALDRGCDTLIAVGGDGTWGNVANAILHTGAAPHIRFAMLAAGTGNDFAKTVGAPVHDIAATAQLALDGADTPTDVGRVGDRYFLNVAGFGVDADVLEDLGNIRWLKGDALYMYAALREVFRYKGMELEFTAAGGAPRHGRHLIVVIANAKNFGGAFRMAPAASTLDGELDAVAILDASPLRRLRIFFAAARGTHEQQPEVTIERASHFTLRFSGPPKFELDGELHQAETAELKVECVPRALRVVRPASDVSPA